jgi:hypothetical protein
MVIHNEHRFAVADRYPVTQGQMLIIAKRHLAEYFELGRPELNAVYFLLKQLKRQLQDNEPSVKGFNVGISCGEAAGQTVALPYSLDSPFRIGPGAPDHSHSIKLALLHPPIFTRTRRSRLRGALSPYLTSHCGISLLRLLVLVH